MEFHLRVMQLPQVEITYIAGSRVQPSSIELKIRYADPTCARIKLLLVQGLFSHYLAAFLTSRAPETFRARMRDRIRSSRYS